MCVDVSAPLGEGLNCLRICRLIVIISLIFVSFCWLTKIDEVTFSWVNLSSSISLIIHFLNFEKQLKP